MKNTVSLFDLFSCIKVEDNYNVLLADVLMTTTAAQVVKDDGLPQNVCGDCVTVLQTIAEFRSNALKVQKELKKLMITENNVKEEFKEETTEDTSDFDVGYETSEICLTSLLPKEEEKPEDVCYQCEKCKNCYPCQDTFLKHLTTHDTSSDALSNVKLEFNSNSIRNTLGNVLLQSDSNVHKCNICDQTFSKERSLMAHSKKHKNNGKTNAFYECDNCGKKFTTKSLLKRHMRLHSVDRPFRCSRCAKMYTRQDQLLEHMKRHNKVKTHICSYCNKGFFQLCSLKDHLRVHTKETPYLCSECGKGFTNNSNLRQHMIRHTGIKSFACTFCPKKFITKGQLVSHIVTHTGTHPYKCDECGASFTKPYSLKKHKFRHLDVKAFACETCNKRFICKDHLKRHQRIHTGEKPYRCKYCERAFSQSNDLIKHMRMHVGQNIYQCTVCNMKFRLLRELKKHYPTHYIKDGKLPTVHIGNGVVAPILLAPEPIPDTTSDATSANGQITLTVADVEVVWPET